MRVYMLESDAIRVFDLHVLINACLIAIGIAR